MWPPWATLNPQGGSRRAVTSKMAVVVAAAAAAKTAAGATVVMAVAVAAEADSGGTSPPHIGGALLQDGSFVTGDGGNLQDRAHKRTGLCFHHYSYGRSATR
jgi:hypothetical protein